MTHTRSRHVSPSIHHPADTSGWRPAVGHPTLGPGTSSLIMVPDVDGGIIQQLPAPPHRVMTRHHRPPTRRTTDDGEAILIASGLLIAFVTLVVVLIGTAKPATAYHAGDKAAGRPQSMNTASSEVALPAPVMEPVKIEPKTQSVMKAAPQQSEAVVALKAATLAHRERALSLLKQARESQSDNIVYRQMLAELVRSYGDTPAGSQALSLLTEGPSNTVTAIEPIAREEVQEAKPSSESPAPGSRYGLGFMN